MCLLRHLSQLPVAYYGINSTITYCFQLITDQQFELIQQLQQQDDFQKEKKKILCKACQYPITSLVHKIEVNGKHRHIFSNPGGFVFEIGCFSLANGCVNQGTPTLKYSWFSGFAWRYALCSNCYLHLGWFYQSEQDSFYGLILNNLLELGE